MAKERKDLEKEYKSLARKINRVYRKEYGIETKIQYGTSTSWRSNDKLIKDIRRIKKELRTYNKKGILTQQDSYFKSFKKFLTNAMPKNEDGSYTMGTDMLRLYNRINRLGKARFIEFYNFLKERGALYLLDKSTFYLSVDYDDIETVAYELNELLDEFLRNGK